MFFYIAAVKRTIGRSDRIFQAERSVGKHEALERRELAIFVLKTGRTMLNIECVRKVAVHLGYGT
jgi:hypothetical protein